jgi:hypothetical protein
MEIAGGGCLCTLTLFAYFLTSVAAHVLVRDNGESTQPRIRSPLFHENSPNSLREHVFGKSFAPCLRYPLGAGEVLTATTAIMPKGAVCGSQSAIRRLNVFAPDQSGTK